MNGVFWSLSEQLMLQVLRDKGPLNAARLFGWYTTHYEPLPFLGDTGYWLVIDGLADARPLISRSRVNGKWNSPGRALICSSVGQTGWP